MPTYVSLINWTEQGIKNFPETTKRAEDFIKLVEASGGRVRKPVWTVAEYGNTMVMLPPRQTRVSPTLGPGQRRARPPHRLLLVGGMAGTALTAGLRETGGQSLQSGLTAPSDGTE